MNSSNPVFGRDPWGENRGRGRARDRQQPVGYGGSSPYGYGPAGDPTYGDPDYGVIAHPGPRSLAAMTVEDVVVRTLGLLAITVAAAAAAWILLPAGALANFALIGAVVIGLVLGLVISLGRITNPVAIIGYAVVEGVLLGLFSRVFENLYSGIVLQAIVCTLAVFGGMTLLYRFRILRATPGFVRWVTGAVIGVGVLMLVNFGLSIFGVNGGNGLGLREYDPTAKAGWLPIVFSLICVGLAALTFILDFAVVEDGVARGVDRRFAWYASFGILVGLIWLYLELLRLLGYARR
ncbi:Bax inhibitor-1/YccA family protein [Fodinicola feengrottensis]|uniref:Bax inhibitor-1/YccA family protein n=1 Tax=Fodinicola feengrottensis TaxID=435914 RepID=UPI0031CF7E7B